MEDSPAVSRRALFAGVGATALAGTLAMAGGGDPASADSGPAQAGSSPRGRVRMRPAYHFSVPDNWKNDPQRPIYLDGEYHYYYLYNADYIDGGEARHGAAPRHAITSRSATAVSPSRSSATPTATAGQAASSSMSAALPDTAKGPSSPW